MKQVVPMAFERRLEAVVLGPGLPGQVKVTLGRGQQQFVADVPVELLDPSLRLPNSEFVAVVKGRDLVRVESAGNAWLIIQNQMRDVLNSDWDPIGVADRPPAKRAALRSIEFSTSDCRAGHCTQERDVTM
jgi:hypothetical protein